MKITTKHSLLALSISLLSSPLYALELMSDESMSEITAQDGVSFRSVATNIAMDRLFWREDSKELQFRNINITGWDSTTTLDFGADSDLASATPALAITSTMQPFLLTVGSVGICNAAVTCATTGGELALQTTTPSTFTFFNTNGLFDASSANGRFRFNVGDANIYIAQSFGGVRNLAMLKKLTLNGTLNGKFSIDSAEGIRAQGTLSLNKSNLNRVNGFQFDLAHKANQATGFTTTGSNTILRFGISGNINNFDARLRADNTLTTGTQGIKFSAKGVLDKNNFQMEIGHPNTYSVIFKNWVDFANGAAVVPSSPDITLGDIYVNLTAAGATLPNFTTGYGAGFGQTAVATTDAYSIAIRGLNWQAYPKVIAFQNNSTFVQTTQNWSLIPALYNLDSNLLLFPDGHPNPAVTVKRGVGFDWNLATTGRDATGKEGTHILVADPAVGTYIGWRNLNTKISFAQGQFYVTDAVTEIANGDPNGVDGIKFTSKNMSFDMAGEFAVGRLPNGSSITTISNTDEMFGLRVRMQGEAAFSFSPSPSPQGYLAMSGKLNLIDPNPTFHSASLAQSVLADPQGLVNSIVITEPSDNTEIQFSDISGVIDIKPEHIKAGEFTDRPSIIGGQGIADYSDATRTEIGNNTVTFATALEFGKGLGATNVFRIGDIGLGIDADSNPLTPATQYRLGEMVIPGGRLYSQITISPQ